MESHKRPLRHSNTDSRSTNLFSIQWKKPGDVPGFLDENYRLGRRYLKSLSTPHILAHQHIVHTDHVVTRFLILSSVLLIARVDVLFLSTLEPANIILIPLTAHRTRIRRFLDLLPLIKYVSLVHIAKFTSLLSEPPAVAGGLRYDTTNAETIDNALYQSNSGRSSPWPYST
jgi:hypothetical protein